ncbi:hypothetical protein SASPL_112014 [Salvia splendens]|uniref:Myb/SANT-like domain-containing protein n=1 Tax=Salvia splendens TaxID=180675 RepID=A0A8X9A3U6_SALSN|nr:hypothetical protein SASPL_112014 [Salvia splendens]
MSMISLVQILVLKLFDGDPAMHRRGAMSNSQRVGSVHGIGRAVKVCTLLPLWNYVSPRQKYHKGDRSRRMWTIREEEILAATLLDLVARGWKSDNGFRAGYLQKIENDIRAEFPNTDIKGTPHVTSRLQAWKKSYTSLCKILGRTGVGFNNDGEYKIDCDNEQWVQIVQADKNARFMRTKSWPLWETWKCIFGKDRASGGGAEDLQAAAVRQREKVTAASNTHENSELPLSEDFPIHETDPVAEHMEQNDFSSGNNERVTATTKSGGRKRKSTSSDDALLDFLGNLHADTNARLEVIAARIGYEFDLGKARQEVVDKLETVDGLTLDERYDLCDILSKNSEWMEVFIGMPPNARLGYLKRFLKPSNPPK